MMTVISRAWRNLRRSPGRTALLTAVLSVVIALGVVGLAVEAGANDGIAGVRRSLGNEVRLSANFGDMRMRAADWLRQPRGGSARLAVASMVEERWAEQLGSLPYVVETDRVLRGWAESQDIALIDADVGGLPAGGLRWLGQQQAAFTLVGGQSAARIAEFADGRRGIASGRLYSDAEGYSAAPVAVIDELLAAHNGLTVGDRFTLADSQSGRTIELEVVGISRDLAPPEQADYGRLAIQSLLGASNTFYVPYGVVQELNAQEGMLTSISFYLDDPMLVEDFRSQAAAAGLDTNEYALWSSDTQFEMMAGPLVKLAGFTRTGLVAVIIAGALVISLLMTLVTRERSLEIGVLRALGASRKAIAVQLAVETLTISALAVLLGLALGASGAQAAADSLLAREVAALHDQGLGRSIVTGAGASIFRLPGMGEFLRQSTPEVNAGIGLRQLGAIAGVGLLLALCGSMVAAFWSMKMDPAAILAARS